MDELRTLIARHSGQRDGIWAVVSESPSGPMHSVYEPAFGLVAQGAKRTVVGNKVLEYGTGQYLVVSVHLPICGHIVQATKEEPFLAAGLTLSPSAIASLLLESAADATVPPSGIAIAHAPDELVESVVRLLHLLDRPKDVRVLRPMIEREILWRLLEGELGGTVRQIGLSDSRLSRINQTVLWVREHFADAFHIEDLAQMAAMSVSSFHRHFRAVTSMTPIQYQKQIRLQEARARLMAQADDVASVGFSVGYDSPSQFSREYSRLFGMPPGRDAERLRSVVLERQFA